MEPIRSPEWAGLGFSMAFYVAKNERPVEKAMSADFLMSADPEYYGPKFEAIAEMRALDDGTLHKGNEFRRVASFVNVPLFRAATTILDPEFMRDKKKFYEWLDRNRQYCTYQRPSKADRFAQVERDLGHLKGGKA